MISLKNISFAVSEDSSFRIRAREVAIFPHDRIILLGRSGSGKTSFLRYLRDHSPVRAIMIDQDLRLVVETTVIEAVAAGALHRVSWHRGIFKSPIELRTEAQELLRALGLAAHMDQQVGNLSQGEKQRVAIARALMAKPDLLLADEPFSALDKETAEKTWKLLTALQSKFGFALLLSVHQHFSFLSECERHWRVDQGVIHERSEGADIREFPSQQDIRKVPRSTSSVWVLIGFFLLSLTAWISLPWGVEWQSASPEKFFRFIFGFFPGSLDALRRLPWLDLARALLETVQMTFAATSLAVCFSLPLALSASEILRRPRWSRPLRVTLSALRTIPSLVWALVFVASVGLGVFSGIFALTAYSIGYLTKFFYESLEDLDQKPAEALRFLGLKNLHLLTRVYLPMGAPALTSSILFMLEYNLRAASVLGLVGAGGIGQDLVYYLEWREFPSAGAAILLLMTVVILFDALSAWLRRRLLDRRGR